MISVYCVLCKGGSNTIDHHVRSAKQLSCELKSFNCVISASKKRRYLSLSPVLARYDPFGVDVPLNFDNTHSIYQKLPQMSVRWTNISCNSIFSQLYLGYKPIIFADIYHHFRMSMLTCKALFAKRPMM